MKPTPMEIEEIFHAACEHFTREAAARELDVVRHERFSNSPLGHTGIAQINRAEATKLCRVEAAKMARLAEICRQLRERAHGHNLSAILSAIPDPDTL